MFKSTHCSLTFMKGFRTGPLRCATVAWGIFWAKGNWEPETPQYPKEIFACTFLFSFNSQLHSKTLSASLLLICLTALFPSHWFMNCFPFPQWLDFYSEKYEPGISGLFNHVHWLLLPNGSHEMQFVQPTSLWDLSVSLRGKESVISHLLISTFFFYLCHTPVVKAIR